MTNFVQDGETITLTAPYDVLSGAGLLVGSIFGVAAFDALSGAPVEACVEGVFNLAKDASAAAAGALIYWDDAVKKATTTVGTNKLIGTALLAAATGDATVRVRLNGAFIA